MNKTFKIFKAIVFFIFLAFFFYEIVDFFSLFKVYAQENFDPSSFSHKDQTFFSKYGIYLAVGFGFFFVAGLAYLVYSSGSPVSNVVSNVVPDVVSNVVSNVAPNVVPDVVSNVAPNVAPNVVSNVVSNVAPNVVPDVTYVTVRMAINVYADIPLDEYQYNHFYNLTMTQAGGYMWVHMGYPL
ncbi:MAG: hypothetical protein IM592_16695 [Bacteroidetes bacterium]|nr:hypothetical protein [Bacteroidota bacterium]